MSNELTKLNDLFGGGALSTQSVEDLKAVDDLSKSTGFLPRIQLYYRGKAIDKNFIAKGHFGSPRSSEDIFDLGERIDVLVIARKPKAIDMSDTDNIMQSNDPKSKEFQRIVDAADNTKDSGCAYGPTYLVFERSTGKFYEFFCGNKSSRIESSKINTYLPVTPAMIEAGVTDEKEPRGPKPMAIKAQMLEKGNWTWFAPQVSECLTPFDKLPSAEDLTKEIEKFLKKDEDGVETVTEDEKKGKRKR